MKRLLKAIAFVALCGACVIEVKAQEVIDITDKPSAEETYLKIWPPLNQDQVIKTPDGPCKRKDWSLYFQRCEKPLAAEDLNKLVFHANEQTYAQHWYSAAQKDCIRELSDLDYAHNWYVEHHGEAHGATQIYGYSLVLKQLYCKHFQVELTDQGPIIVQQ